MTNCGLWAGRALSPPTPSPRVRPAQRPMPELRGLLLGPGLPFLSVGPISSPSIFVFVPELRSRVLLRPLLSPPRNAPMKTFLLHHTPKSADQDTWTVSFSLPYIASEYARVSPGVWYVRTWLSAEQIKRRLAILFDHPDELGVHELGRADRALAERLNWMQGRLEDDDSVTSWPATGRVWAAVQSALSTVARPLP